MEVNTRWVSAPQIWRERAIRAVVSSFSCKACCSFRCVELCSCRSIVCTEGGSQSGGDGGKDTSRGKPSVRGATSVGDSRAGCGLGPTVGGLAVVGWGASGESSTCNSDAAVGKGTSRGVGTAWLGGVVGGRGFSAGSS